MAGMIRISAALLALACFSPVAHADPAEPTAPPTKEPKVDLKPGPGKDTVETNCNVCHSLDYIRINAGFMSLDGWKAEVTKMRKAFGASIDDGTAETVLRYLVATYGVAQQPASAPVAKPAPMAKKEKQEPR